MSLNILITGGTSGIGLELARLYRSQGHLVGIAGRSKTRFDELEDKESFQFYQLDVSNKNHCSAVMDQFIYTNKKIDIVIASAGLSFEKKTSIPDFEISRKIIDINLIGTLNIFAPAINYMMNQKSGQLVGIASVAGFCGFPGVSAYSASKAAVIKLCEGYSVDLKRYGISTTCIAPGFVDTPLTQKNPHPMPFMIKADKAAVLIEKAIRKKKTFFTFPFFFSRILILLSFLPRKFFVKIMSIEKFNYSTGK